MMGTFLKVSYNMPLEATDGFCLENLLGARTLGCVCKGIPENMDQRPLFGVKYSTCMQHLMLLRILW